MSSTTIKLSMPMTFKVRCKRMPSIRPSKCGSSTKTMFPFHLSWVWFRKISKEMSLTFWSNQESSNYSPRSLTSDAWSKTPISKSSWWLAYWICLSRISYFRWAAFNISKTFSTITLSDKKGSRGSLRQYWESAMIWYLLLQRRRVTLASNWLQSMRLWRFIDLSLRDMQHIMNKSKFLLS